MCSALLATELPLHVIERNTTAVAMQLRGMGLAHGDLVGLIGMTIPEKLHSMTILITIWPLVLLLRGELV